MAYCSISDVYNVGVHGGTTFTNDLISRPTENQVTEAINRIYREINSHLFSVSVNIPVDVIVSPNAYALLKDLNAIGAAAESELIAWNEIRGDQFESGFTPSMFLKIYKDKLKFYTEYPIRLIDAVLGDSHTKLLTVEDIGTPWCSTIDHYDSSYWDGKGNMEVFRQDDIW